MKADILDQDIMPGCLIRIEWRGQGQPALWDALKSPCGEQLSRMSFSLGTLLRTGQALPTEVLSRASPMRVKEIRLPGSPQIAK